MARLMMMMMKYCIFSYVDFAPQNLNHTESTISISKSDSQPLKSHGIIINELWENEEWLEGKTKGDAGSVGSSNSSDTTQVCDKKNEITTGKQNRRIETKVTTWMSKALSELT